MCCSYRTVEGKARTVEGKACCAVLACVICGTAVVTLNEETCFVSSGVTVMLLSSDRLVGGVAVMASPVL